MGIRFLYITALGALLLPACGGDQVPQDPPKCVDETIAAFCARLPGACGTQVAPNNCGVEKTYDCGIATCQAGLGCTKQGVCGTCDPLLASSCGDSKGCYPTSTGLACQPAGTGAWRAECAADTDCKHGLGCDTGSGFCRNFCKSGEPTTCADGEFCEVASGKTVGICRVLACDPLVLPSCASTMGCYLISNHLVCRPEGALGAGEACQAEGDCKRGLACLAPEPKVCRPHCDIDAIQDTCAQGTKCQMAESSLATCIPIPFSTCNPLDQTTCPADKACIRENFYEIYVCGYNGINGDGGNCKDGGCMRGFDCIDEKCRKICELNKPGACPENFKCRKLVGDNIAGRCDPL